jgi:EAL domain-containing protein (putative c-di-GMP-specific phosphodiesterase class I)
MRGFGMRRNSSVTTPPLSEHVRAHFQPIFSVDSDRVYAYEALGRRLLPDGTVCSLGPFFSDPAISDEQALRVDRIVRQAALRKYAEDGPDAYLFLNIRLTWLCAFNDHPQDMLTIRWAEECGIRPDRLVIEITEDECRSDMRSYMRAIEFYKRQGCRVAIDDYGKNASDIDRLSVILPDIIKINIEYIHKSVTSYHYKAYLQA